MKGILKLENGKELTVEIDENTLKSIEEPKKTGYERVELGSQYYVENPTEPVEKMTEDGYDVDELYYSAANYYSDKTVAENNARADNLMRKLRRFAVEHRKQKLDWNNTNICKYPIYYRIASHDIIVGSSSVSKGFGHIYFDTKETAEKAIEEFKDELIWYFTEYKDSL